jgi:hypothetical protein
MNEAESPSAEAASWPQRKRIKENVKKPVIYPGNLIIIGTPDIPATIDHLYPDDGNRRRESLILARVWAENLKGQSCPKSALIALAAHALQATDKAFGDQPRKNGDGFSRAKCTMSKTCNWMITEGLFVEVGKAPTPNPATVPDPVDQPDVPEPTSQPVEAAVSPGAVAGGVMRALTHLKDLWQ